MTLATPISQKAPNARFCRDALDVSGEGGVLPPTLGQ
ncbi:hypothetical protein PF011_g9627 [Phytophthora fragariae]|uniref:Uncharacterized protein n=1 Tax=Phytophthora fragariae TaxID=53985 RepID=A0A6A3KUF0_9STRA|nr:hypothetical protein PF011_g9627 [Phytophthora fragariae]